MPDTAIQLAKQLGLVGLALKINEAQISLAEFEAAVTHIEGVLKRDGDRLGKIVILAKDRARWEQDILPKLRQAFDYQLQAVAQFHAYTQHPGEDLLLKGVELIKRSGEMMQAVRQKGVLSAGMQKAIDDARLLSLDSHLEVHQFPEGTAASELDF